MFVCSHAGFRPFTLGSGIEGSEWILSSVPCGLGPHDSGYRLCSQRNQDQVVASQPGIPEQACTCITSGSL